MISVMEIAEEQNRLPLSHQQITAHLIHKHKNDVFRLVDGLFKDFDICDPKDRVKIAQTLFPYFFVKADLAVSSNLMDELSRKAQNMDGLSVEQLKLLERIILALKSKESLKDLLSELS